MPTSPKSSMTRLAPRRHRDFWEFSATGFRPIDESNEAYKLGVNYIIYGLTH